MYGIRFAHAPFQKVFLARDLPQLKDKAGRSIPEFLKLCPWLVWSHSLTTLGVAPKPMEACSRKLVVLLGSPKIYYPVRLLHKPQIQLFFSKIFGRI